MAWPGGPDSRNFLRRATARLLLLAVLLLIFTADRLHNHPGTSDFPGGLVTGGSGVELSAASGPAASGRGFPCPACLHHRTCSVDPCRHDSEGRPVAVSGEHHPPFDFPPPAAPAVSRTAPRAPPRSC